MKINLKKNQNALIIGDIHGCYDEMINLIEKSGIKIGTDIIISVGDIVDRGYKTHETVLFFKQTPNAFAIMGNHEIKHIKKMINNESLFDKRNFSGEIQRYMLSKNEYIEIIDFISTLPLYIELKLYSGEKYLIVHAGWKNSVNEDNLQLKIIKNGEIDSEIKYILGIGSAGRIGFDNKSTPWFNSFEGNYKIVFGHTKYKNVERGTKGNIFGIDTGCYEGNKLSALLLPSEEIFDVKAKKNYFEEILSERLDSVLLCNYNKLDWKDKEIILKNSKSLELLEKIELDFKVINHLSMLIKKKADNYKKDYGEINDEMRKEIGINWNKNEEFPEEISNEVKKAFFSRYSIKNLFKYDINEIKSILNSIDN